MQDSIEKLFCWFDAVLHLYWANLVHGSKFSMINIRHGMPSGRLDFSIPKLS